MVFGRLLTFNTRICEAHLPMNQSHDVLRGHLRTALNKAHNVTEDWGSNSAWVSDVFPEHVVYQHGGQTYRRPYTASYVKPGADPTIALGEAKPVHRAYVVSKANESEAVLMDMPEGKSLSLVSAAEQESVTVTLPDGAERVNEGVTLLGSVNVKESKLGVVPIKIIGPGWGSMAYYSKEMLKRDGPKVYTKGTPMFWNHATEGEESQRPEGDLNNLAAVLTKDAEWKESGAKGPGLYSEAKVFSDYADQVREKGAHIGVSINAAIKGREGVAEGRQGRIAEQLIRAFSVDFVTRAGAGGAPLVPVTESDRGHVKETAMTEQDEKDLRAENTRLKESETKLTTRLSVLEASQDQVLAIASVAAVLKEAGIPYRQALLERACEHPVMKEGKPDTDWVKGVVKDFSEGVGGSVTDLGERHVEGERRTAETDDKKVQARMREAMKDLGVPDKGLDFAVAGRA